MLEYVQTIFSNVYSLVFEFLSGAFPEAGYLSVFAVGLVLLLTFGFYKLVRFAFSWLEVF